MNEVQAAAEVTSPRTLPPPAIDPEDIRAIIPGISPDDAATYASLATLAVEATIWPNVLPVAPLPPPLHAATLGIACRFARVGGTVETVVSETIGGYTYRLADPMTAEGAFALTDFELDAIEPWMSQKSALSLHVGSSLVSWPIDWWQRDLDNPVKALDESVSAETES
jgi:hypothetical protein